MNIKKKFALASMVVLLVTIFTVPAEATTGSDIWNSIKDKGSEIADTVRENGPGWVDTAKDKAGELYAAGKEKLPEVIDSAKEGLQGASEQFHEFRNNQEDQFWDWFDGQTSSDSGNAGSDSVNTPAETPDTNPVAISPESSSTDPSAAPEAQPNPPKDLPSGLYEVDGRMFHYDADTGEWTPASLVLTEEQLDQINNPDSAKDPTTDDIESRPAGVINQLIATPFGIFSCALLAYGAIIAILSALLYFVIFRPRRQKSRS